MAMPTNIENHNGVAIDLDRSIPFKDVLTILVSIFLLFRDERKGRESVQFT